MCAVMFSIIILKTYQYRIVFFLNKLVVVSDILAKSVKDIVHNISSSIH